MSPPELDVERDASADAFRERIVQASIELIEEQGLSALSVREVARRAGVSHQAPYHYFEDREAILGAIAEQGFRMLRDKVSAVAPPKAGGALHEQMMAAGDAYIRFALAHPAYFRVMFRPELVAPERHPNVMAEGDRACSICYDIVRAAASAGLPADPSIDALFLLFWSVGHGFACLALDGPLDVIFPGADREAQLRDVLRAFSMLMDSHFAAAGRLKRSPAVKRKVSRSPRKRA